MDFPIVALMDQEGCRQKLFDLLHPEGFACPRCGAREGLNIHRRRPDTPIVDHRCRITAAAPCRVAVVRFVGDERPRLVPFHQRPGLGDVGL